MLSSITNNKRKLSNILATANHHYAVVWSFAISLFILIITGSSQLTADAATDSIADDHIWYIGKGAKENMYLTYKIRDNNTEAYLLTIYFEKKDDMSWTALFLGNYYDSNRRANQSVILSDFDMSPSYNMTQEMKPFISGYYDALQYMWLFSVKPGHSLSRLNETWYEAGCLDCTGPTTTRIGIVETPAGKFNATLVSHETGLKVWINKDLPFSIAGVTYVGPTRETVNTPHEFELQEIGNGYPVALPEFAVGMISVTELGLFSITGEEITQVEVGQQSRIRVSIQNDVEYNQPFVLLIEVRDGYGITRQLAWQSGEIVAKGGYSMETSWLPTDDCWLDDECAYDYSIRSFVISSFDSPDILSGVSSTNGIRVVGFPPDLPLDQHQFDLLLDDGRTYTLNYSFSTGDGRILGVEDNHENDTIRILLASPQESRFTLTIPSFLNSHFLVNDAPEAVGIEGFVDGENVTFDTFFDDKAQNYTYVFTLKPGASEIEIVGQPTDGG